MFHKYHQHLYPVGWEGCPCIENQRLLDLWFGLQLTVSHHKFLFCLYTELQPTPLTIFTLWPSLQLDASTISSPTCSFRGHFGIAFEATLVMQGKNNSWPTYPFNYTNKNHIAQAATKCAQIPGFTTEAPINIFTLGTSTFRFYCGPTLQGSHLAHYTFSVLWLASPGLHSNVPLSHLDWL